MKKRSIAIASAIAVTASVALAGCNKSCNPCAASQPNAQQTTSTTTTNPCAASNPTAAKKACNPCAAASTDSTASDTTNSTSSSN